ncbi:cytochrome c [Flavobacteriaceae bacterium]|jgi:mono/diheme cytochrome c family protein|nr:cytochrome c [Flavobacteriaceae bacterium]MDA9328318.1 cytochrome c [Flavobacteriaceae bacterium]MDA9338312.1 cytochrome c [Flavobacteriaceae bacterium]MDA9354131.1 cytochrome c [Flavobacteriaceae bacterium]MDA9773223.1 cytochrome c [Flavobacteriaceae bacterium]|tara:strand:- start:867 stop:1415 length:549 start_codon:yes stop_codon:yes gene_type:complete
MRKYIKFNIALLVLATIVSCSDKRERQYQYMPDMYVAVPYEADAEKGNTGFSSNLKPVNGSIARGNVPYEYSNSNAAYEKAKANLTSPLVQDETSLEKGKKMYTIYCVSCHGKKGDGNGYLSQAEKFIGIPSYKDRDITEGSIYHVIMHGKNLMGSHASQITHDERWQIIQYVGKLRNDLLK